VTNRALAEIPAFLLISMISTQEEFYFNLIRLFSSLPFVFHSMAFVGHIFLLKA
jgi:hypothetical protein